jgi:hypothetical protein
MLLPHHQNAGQNQDIKIANCVTVQIFANDGNILKCDSGGNYEEVEVWKCLLPFSLEPSVLPSLSKNVKIRIYQDCNFAFGSV